MNKRISIGLILSIFAISLNAQHNVVLIIADDLGTDYLGFYEDAKDTVNCPNLRALLKKGVRFVNANSNPVCSSTRAGILTGRYSFRTGVGNIVGGTGGSGALDTAEMSIPKLLKIHNPNIAKANIGKWHLHNPTPASNLQNPLRLGYDHYEGPFIGQLTSYTNWTKYTNGVQSTCTNYATSENVNNAVSWIKTTGNKQFFLWLAFNAPHAPYHLPPANLHTYTGLSGTQQNINQNPKLYFKAMLQAFDTELGRFMDSLKKLNKFDSTDFIFIGDNGNTIQTAQISNTDKAKGTVYDYGVHVPFIVSGPAVVNGGRASQALVNTADIFATVLELMGANNWKNSIPSNKPVDSKSLLPIIKGTSATTRSWIFSEIFKATTDSLDGKAMRNDKYKLIKFDYGKQEFYNLSSDPLETNNLLNGTLSATDLVNYNYLCNEMTNLVGKGTFCNNSLSTKNTVGQTVEVWPNPFHSKIFVSNEWKNRYCTLWNSQGKLIYSGNAITEQDFAYLKQGIYLLKTETQNVVKLLK